MTLKAVKSYNRKSITGATGVIGHYTQNVWAETREVGCGMIKYIDDSGYSTTVSLCYIIRYITNYMII